jgi:hypothetical protein
VTCERYHCYSAESYVASDTAKEFAALTHQSNSLLFLHDWKLCLYSKRVSILSLKDGTQNGNIHKYGTIEMCFYSIQQLAV